MFSHKTPTIPNMNFIQNSKSSARGGEDVLVTLEWRGAFFYEQNQCSYQEVVLQSWHFSGNSWPLYTAVQVGKVSFSSFKSHGLQLMGWKCAIACVFWQAFQWCPCSHWTGHIGEVPLYKHLSFHNRKTDKIHRLYWQWLSLEASVTSRTPNLCLAGAFTGISKPPPRLPTGEHQWLYTLPFPHP